MDREIFIAYHSTGCNLLNMTEDKNGGRLTCPKGAFRKKDVKSHEGGWFLSSCNDCKLSQPLSRHDNEHQD